MIKRQLRWNRFIDTGEQSRLRYRYVVAIFNEPRDIRIIERKLLEQLAPADEFMDICDWAIPGTNGLHCKVVSFSSSVGKIEHPEKVYDNSSFYYDRRLLDVDEVRLTPYLRELTGVA